MMMPKKLLILTSLALVGFLIFSFIKQVRQKSFFDLEEISKPLPFYEKWEIDPLSNEEKISLEEALSQPYSYLGKGAQSYAFLSKDGHYVIKFFKFKHLQLNFIQSIIPELGPLKKWKENKLKEKSKKLEKLFDAYRLAFEVHRKESALVYIHLNPTDKLLPALDVLDPSGKKVSLNLDSIPFLIQKKVEITRSIFERLFKAKKVDEVKLKINQIVELYLSEYRKGIFDHDHGVMHNTGFIDGLPVHLDVGKIYFDEAIKLPENAYLDLVKIGWKIREHMLRKFPEHEKEITRYLNTTIGNAFKRHLDYDQIDGAILWKR